MTRRKYPDSPPKKEKVWLPSCIAVVLERHQTLGPTSGFCSLGGRKPTMSAGRVPDKRLMRRRITQGPPFKGPLIREYLWDWFVDIRRSVASSISPKFVLMKAKSIAEEILKAQRSSGCYAPLPKLDQHWLLRWKRDKGVVFRKPNMRFKTSKTILTTRLRAMWLNTIRVRRLAQRLLGKDLSDQMYGVDEKPLHFNESGSKHMRTLELVGAPSVRHETESCCHQRAGFCHDSRDLAVLSKELPPMAS